MGRAVLKEVETGATVVAKKKVLELTLRDHISRVCHTQVFSSHLLGSCPM